MITWNDFLEKEIALFKAYLLEYCEVNGIDEAHLGKMMEIVYFPRSRSLVVLNTESEPNVKLGVTFTYAAGKVQSFEFFGAFTEEKSKYPKTSVHFETLTRWMQNLKS